MKILYLVRHAKAAHGDMPDRDRPLADRGRQAHRRLAHAWRLATRSPT